MLKYIPILASLALILPGCAPATQTTPKAAQSNPKATQTDRKGAVSAADPRATAAGEEILAKGGSASDAAIAVMLALTVVEPQSSGIGGGGFMLRAGAGEGADAITTFDGRETAPAAATPRRFVDTAGKVLPGSIRTTSGLSVGVPGNIALAAKVHAQHGTLPWADLFQPAIRLARDGFTMNRRLNNSLAERSERAGKTAAARAVFFGADGEPLPVGTTVRVPELAATLERLAAKGPSAFYEDAAEEFATYVAAETPQDGRMTSDDVRAYRVKERPAVCAPYRQYTVCGMGPPSSGGVAVAQMLGQLERFDIATMGPNSPTFWHLFLESQRLAYADRELYMGDSDFVEVPVSGMIDADYMTARGALISADSALDEALPGTPPGAPLARADGNEPPEHGTTHFSVVDGKGNAISYTSTIEGAFGSGLYWGGFYLNNELTDFSLTPDKDGVPVANRVEGGKRPRSSMAPTIVYDNTGKVVLVIGAAGGPTIPVQVTRSIIGVLDFGMSAEQALDLPLIMAFGPTIITEEGSSVAGMQAQFTAKGHSPFRLFPPRGKTNALLRTANGWEAAGDPRVANMLSYVPGCTGACGDAP